MKKMTELIKTYLGDIIRKIAPKFDGQISVDVTLNKDYGDYATSIAFGLAKVIKKPPKKIAEEIAEKLKKISEFSKVEAKNGFINFYLSEECLHHQLGDILKQKNKYGWIDAKKFPPSSRLRRTIQVEFISSNPTGPPTIGNGRGGFFGDVLSNILETQGHKVTREFYVNDRGGQILALGRSIKLAQGEKLNLEKTELKNLYKGNYINELAKQIDKSLNIEEVGQKAADLILDTYIKPVVRKMGISFDVWFSEKSLYKGGEYEKVMKNLMKKDLIYEKDGATWIKTSELGDGEDRVLIKSNGDETYFMSDIIYHLNKFNIRKFDKVINIWGADHHGDVLRLMSVLKILGVDLERFKIILIQFIRLISGGKGTKVSKRAGTFVTFEDLIEKVGLDAARFFFLMHSNDTHMDFDIALAKERSAKNPVYYVQYAHARLSSILRKSQIPNPKSQTNFKIQIPNPKLLKEKEEFNLIRKLVEYPEILSDIAKNYEVHRLPRYALELAREFHNFYEKERVITGDKNLTSARLALVMATKIVLANTLNLMGIKAPDRM